MLSLIFVRSSQEIEELTKKEGDTYPEAKHGGWNKANFDLSNYVGKTIAVIGLRFKANEVISNYSMKLGELAVTNKNISQNSSEPMNLKIEKVYIQEDKAEAFVQWNFDENNLWYYDLYKVQVNGKREYIGRIHDECYYVKEIIREGSENDCTIEVVKVNLDGSEGICLP